jgi:hypothetical protein
MLIDYKKSIFVVQVDSRLLNCASKKSQKTIQPTKGRALYSIKNRITIDVTKHNEILKTRQKLFSLIDFSRLNSIEIEFSR